MDAADVVRPLRARFSSRGVRQLLGWCGVLGAALGVVAHPPRPAGMLGSDLRPAGAGQRDAATRYRIRIAANQVPPCAGRECNVQMFAVAWLKDGLVTRCAIRSPAGQAYGDAVARDDGAVLLRDIVVDRPVVRVGVLFEQGGFAVDDHTGQPQRACKPAPLLQARRILEWDTERSPDGRGLDILCDLSQRTCRSRGLAPRRRQTALGPATADPKRTVN